MKTNILKISTICTVFITMLSHDILTTNNRSYILIMNKIAQKGDLNDTLVDIAQFINNNSDEKIDIKTIRDFIETDAGKNLKNSFASALNPNRYVLQPLSAIGLFMHDFYTLNIFGNQTEDIGKIFEMYLLTLHGISAQIDFKDITTAKDFVKKHRCLFSQETISNTTNTVRNLVNIIRNAPFEKLTDATYLENVLLLELGLNDVNLYEFPSHLNQYYGKGFKTWEYPVQFAKFLVSLSKLQLNNYLEINVGRGTFVIVSEYLKRFNPNLKSYAINPQYSLIMDVYTNDINSDTEYILDFSTSKKFIDISSMQWDITFVDGDRSFEGITTQYNLIKKNSDILVFQDIVSDPCPGVVSLWNILKKVYYKKNKIDEFIEQYEEVSKRQNQKYMGLGVIYKNVLK